MTNSNMSLLLCPIKAIPGRKIVHYTSVLNSGSFDMTNGHPTTITRKQMESRVACPLKRYPVVVVVRQFLERKDPGTGLPFKNIYVFLITYDRGLSIRRLTPEEHRYCHGDKSEPLCFYK